jgi:predicted  nucleic acid-binding Zn-ribbon protein
VSDRARFVYALLRTLFAWTPAPPASRTGVTLAQQQRGFVTKHRFMTCPDCLANGRPEGMRGCETCGGRGEIADDGSDPYEQKRIVKYGLADHDQRKDRERQRDDELRRLEFQLLKPARKVDEVAGDVLTRSVELRDRMYRHGDYEKVEAQLAVIRLEHPALYEVAMTVAYSPLVDEPIEPVRRVVVALCELIAARIEGDIRVPAGVHIWTADELAARSREAKAALQWGHSEWASATRAERKRAILLLHDEGLSDSKIARRFGLTRQWVQRVRAGVVAAMDEAA